MHRLFLLVPFFLGVVVGQIFSPTKKVDPYEKIILKESAYFALSPNLVKAVIITESGGDANAISSKGACGLMQLMPKTAEELAKELDMPPFSKEMLLSPEINIRLGCFYLHKLMHKFSGNLSLSLAAYNTGYARVEKWVQQSPLWSAEEIISHYASAETKNFVHRVLIRKKRKQL